MSSFIKSRSNSKAAQTLRGCTRVVQNIEENEPITVQYTVDTSYFPNGCSCATCKPESPPVAPRKRTSPGMGMGPDDNKGCIQEGSGKKRTRRGGRRGLSKHKQSVQDPIVP